VPKVTPLPPVFEPALFEPVLPCWGYRPRLERLMVGGADLRHCVPRGYPNGLPLELSVTQGRVTAFRFYSQCTGHEYGVDPIVRVCISRAVKTWRFDTRFQCPGPASHEGDEETVQLYVLPLGHSVQGDELARRDVGVGCAAG
jgi:hypothetical protein